MNTGTNEQIGEKENIKKNSNFNSKDKTSNTPYSTPQSPLQKYNKKRHVILPKELSKTLPKNRLLSDAEWRGIGVQQSRGWQHYAIHRPEPHILLFRRRLGTDPQTGKVDPELQRIAMEEMQDNNSRK